MLARQSLYSNRALAGSLKERHEALRARCADARAAIDEELRVALRELAAIYLPSLTPPALAGAADLSGFRGFERRDPIAAREHERHVLESTIKSIEAGAQFQDRERLVGERGELTSALTGAEEALATAQAPCDRFEQQETFLELIAVHYDTPQFDVPWWRADYWRLWAAGDRICRDLGLDDFGDDVLPAYKSVAEPRDFYRAEVARLRADVHKIHEVVRQRDEAAARLQQLDTIYLDQAWGYLAEHLGFADLGLLHEWAERADPAWAQAIRNALKKIAGIRAKTGYVDDMLRGIGGVSQQLGTRIDKYNRKIGKLDRGKYIPESEIAGDTLPAKAASMEAQAQKTEQRLDRLVAARNYDDFDPSWEHERWWWHLTQSPPTRLCPHTHGWYGSHPEVMVHAEHDADVGTLDDGVARAFVSGRDGESSSGYLS